MADGFDELDFAATLRAGEQPLLRDRYRIVRELGRGGMGTVYLAEDLQLDGRKVAIKMPAAVLSRNPRAVRDLKREAMLAMELSHPNIVTLRAFEETDEGVFLVLDYVDGRSLEDLLAEKETLSEAEVVEIFAPIAQALDYAHTKKVVHRDIKPSNIILAADGTPYLMDFGVARELKDTFTRVTGRSDTSGTLPYMSPEQLMGDTPTPAQDVYSLAATMYECLSGHPPFFRGDIQAQIMAGSPCPPDTSALSSQLMLGLSLSPSVRPSPATTLLLTAPPDADRPSSACTPARCPRSRPVSDRPSDTGPPPSVAHAVPPTPFDARIARTAPEAQQVQRAWACHLESQLPQVRDLPLSFALIPPGSFIAGSPVEEPGRDTSEAEQLCHVVTPFLLSTSPVTVGTYRIYHLSQGLPQRSAWAVFLGSTWDEPGFPQDDAHPVVYISWTAANAFAQWFSLRFRVNARLPTQVEWEYACRAGSTTPFSHRPQLSLSSANFQPGGPLCEDSPAPFRAHTSPVGTFPPNPWELYDMHGNVREWCHDTWPTGAVTLSGGLTSSALRELRVSRGGGWPDRAIACRAASRHPQHASQTEAYLGFRLLLELPRSC